MRSYDLLIGAPIFSAVNRDLVLDKNRSSRISRKVMREKTLRETAQRALDLDQHPSRGRCMKIAGLKRVYRS